MLGPVMGDQLNTGFLERQEEPAVFCPCWLNHKAHFMFTRKDSTNKAALIVNELCFWICVRLSYVIALHRFQKRPLWETVEVKQLPLFNRLRGQRRPIAARTSLSTWELPCSIQLSAHYITQRLKHSWRYCQPTVAVRCTVPDQLGTSCC